MLFSEAYAKLNIFQKKAVDTLDGPVMVIAGPGTGKTQVLSLRIANILEKTDTPASGILCLTFTRSGVSAMRSRLEEYIGSTAREVVITTFHGFSLELIERYYTLLGFYTTPKILEDTDRMVLFDEILETYEWQYIRPRANPSLYFSDISSLISLLKKEEVTPEQFLDITQKEIDFLKNDPDSFSSRGPRKGELKKEIETQIQSLERTVECVRFYEIYESLKRERALMDYDDILSYVVELVTISEDVRAELRENFLYVLIDEHQDSSGIQNTFLKIVWQSVEKPNIFVVGDDRQLIYGFSGASFDYFSDFQHIFGKVTLVTLSENYRSTQDILSLGDQLLKSSLATESLMSNKREQGTIALAEYYYPRDEILAAGMYFKSQIEKGTKPEECALLVPKNYQVRNATEILKALDLPISSTSTLSLFSSNYFSSFIKILQLIQDPTHTNYLSEVLLDPFFGVPVLQAHAFSKSKKGSVYSIDDFKKETSGDGLFGEQNEIARLGLRLESLVEELFGQKVSYIVSSVGNEWFIDTSKNYQDMVIRVEMVRTCIHLALLWEERHIKSNLSDFLDYLLRLQKYEHTIPLASFGAGQGIQIMTLHKSKGLEYEHVWIAHMNEEVLMTEKRIGFVLPEDIKKKIQEKNISSVTRELYVALTRAKSDLTFSYSAHDYKEAHLRLSSIIESLDTIYKKRIPKEQTEKELLSYGPNIFVQKSKITTSTKGMKEVQDFVRENFSQTRISVSMLNNFFECPWKWYFRNFLKLPEIKSNSLSLGSAVHSVLEYILKQEILPTEKTLQEKLALELEKEGVYEKNEHRRLFKDGLLIIENWITEYYSTVSKNRVSERSLGFKDSRFPTLSMYGKIDLTEILSSGDIVVTDFKTGSEKTKGVIEKLDQENRLSSYMRQLAMYAYLFKQVEKKDVKELRLLFLESDSGNKNKLYTTHIGEEIIDMLVKDIVDYKTSLEDGTWIDRNCYHVSYGKERTECEYCRRAKNIFG